VVVAMTPSIPTAVSERVPCSRHCRGGHQRRMAMT
jgi:hypothetical protein